MNQSAPVNQSTGVGVAFSLQGYVSVVTGSTAGIGLGIARALGQAGSRVVITSRRLEAVQRVAGELAAEGIDARGIAADVRHPGQVTTLIEQVIGDGDRLDVLVNCAGGSFGDTYRAGPLLELEPDDFLESYRSNVVSAFLCSRAALPHLQRSGHGSIINVASMAPIGAVSRNMGSYAATKAAMITLSRTMAAEWGPAIRVNAIAPGHIDTPRTTASRSAELLTRLKSEILLGRLGTAQDVAWAACYLAAPASEWVTGSLIQLDGGESLS